MKIRGLKITNYKIFENIEFDFTDNDGNVLDTIVVVGENGTGKTSLLKLLIAILTPEIKIEFENVEIEIEFDSDEIVQLNKSFKNYIDLSNSGVEQTILDEIPYFLRSINNNKIYRFSIEVDSVVDESGIITGEKILIKDNLPLLKHVVKELNNKFVIAYLRSNIFDKKVKDFSNTLKHIIDYDNFNKDIEKYFDKVIYRYLLENREFSADEIIKKRIDEINYLLKDIDISTKILDIDDNKLVFENAQGNRLEMSDLSDGEKQIYYRAIFLNSIQLKNSLIFVDEPELSLHPRWQMIVSKLYQNAGKNNQVFLATHSPHIISSINPDSLFILHYSDNQLKSNNVGGKENYTRGLEPNRILNEIMGTPLRPFAIQEKIEYVNQFLDVDFNTHKMHNVIKELIGLLGRADPFIIRLNHQLLLLNRKKSKK